MTKNKAKVIQENQRILETTLPKYLVKLEENNKFLENKLQEWESIHPTCNNPANLQKHLQTLTKELNEWRTLMPNCQTVPKARTFLKKHLGDQIIISESHNFDWDLYYGDFKQYMAENGHEVYIFDNLESFMYMKMEIINIIFDQEKDNMAKIGYDFKYHFIDFFKYKYTHNIQDENVNVKAIFENKMVII